MLLTLAQSATALGAGLVASFLGVGGVPPYAYAVAAGGAGGSVNPTTGVYTAPALVSSDPRKAYDLVTVTDSVSAMAGARILVGTPLLLLGDIVKQELELASDRIYLWNQKIPEPADSGLYVAISVPFCKPFGNANETTPDGSISNQFVAMQATVDFDLISRGPEVRDRKEELIAALNSDYARRQGDANAFSVSRLSTDFLNLSWVDGAAIPYRYKITTKLLYSLSRSNAVAFFDTFGFLVFTEQGRGRQPLHEPHQDDIYTDPTPGVEVSYAFPVGTFSFELTNVGDVTVFGGFAAGDSLDPVKKKTLYRYAPFGQEGLDGTSRTLYFSSSRPSQRIEITYWT